MIDLTQLFGRMPFERTLRSAMYRVAHLFD